VRLWEADTGKEPLALSGHTGRVSGVALSTDGQRLASASEGQTVRLWDAATGEEVVRLPGHSN
jgi:WD40 repeat protein